VASLEERIQRVEDELAIRQLRSRYSYAVDERRWDELVELFAEDAVVSMMGKAEGRAELLPYFRDFIGGSLQHMWHFIHNQTVEIDGDTAAGNAMVEMKCVVDGEPRIVGAKYLDTFVKVDGTWLFQSRYTSETTYFNAPHSEGWREEYIEYAPYAH
jgi:ketosteroid isomerase-like protein